MNIFDYVNFYYIISVNIIASATINSFEIKSKTRKKFLTLALGIIVALGFGAVDFYYSQGDFAQNFQKLFLSFTIAVFMYDYTIKLIMEFFKSKVSK
jgi:hypothetical protein